MKHAVVRRLNLLAQTIRREGLVSFGQICVKCDTAPSTLYGYIPLLIETFVDITYNEGIFEHHCTTEDCRFCQGRVNHYISGAVHVRQNR